MKKGYTFHICRENSGKLWHLLLLKIYSEGKGKGGMEFFQGLSMQGCMYAFLHMAVSVHLSSLPLLTYSILLLHVPQYTGQLEFLLLQTTKARVVKT